MNPPCIYCNKLLEATYNTYTWKCIFCLGTPNFYFKKSNIYWIDFYFEESEVGSVSLDVNHNQVVFYFGEPVNVPINVFSSPQEIKAMWQRFFDLKVFI